MKLLNNERTYVALVRFVSWTITCMLIGKRRRTLWLRHRWFLLIQSIRFVLGSIGWFISDLILMSSERNNEREEMHYRFIGWNMFRRTGWNMKSRMSTKLTRTYGFYILFDRRHNVTIIGTSSLCPFHFIFEYWYGIWCHVQYGESYHKSNEHANVPRISFFLERNFKR